MIKDLLLQLDGRPISLFTMDTTWDKETFEGRVKSYAVNTLSVKAKNIKNIVHVPGKSINIKTKK